MAAGNAHRERYREYTNFLRASAAGLNIQVAPARLERLRSRINLERNKFTSWMVVWILIAVVSLVPVLMLASVEFSVPSPDSWAVPAGTFYNQVAIQENVGAIAFAISTALLFVVAVSVAYIPIIANSDSLNDLESAHRALKGIEKE